MHAVTQELFSTFYLLYKMFFFTFILSAKPLRALIQHRRAELWDIEFLHPQSWIWSQQTYSGERECYVWTHNDNEGLFFVDTLTIYTSAYLNCILSWTCIPALLQTCAVFVWIVAVTVSSIILSNQYISGCEDEYTWASSQSVTDLCSPYHLQPV